MTAATVLAPVKQVGRYWLTLGSIVALALGGLLGALLFATDSASAATMAIEQCNGVGGGGGQTVQCNVSVINTLTADPTTTGSVITMNGASTSSPDLVTSVAQCNGAANGGGSVLECHVRIINNIALSGPASATSVSINQCNSNDPDSLGTAPHTCSPPPVPVSGATITQCNATGNGGGLVNPSHCRASGTASPQLIVTVDQCNGSANGGGSQVNCSTEMTTNVVDTSVEETPTTTATTTGGGGTTPGGGGTTPGGGGTTPGGGGTTPGGGGTTPGGGDTTPDAGAAGTTGSGSSTGTGSDTGTAGSTGGAPSQGGGTVVADAKLTG